MRGRVAPTPANCVTLIMMAGGRCHPGQPTRQGICRAGTATEASATDPPSSGALVLLVDADAGVRRSVAAGLELDGFPTVTAPGARAALEFAKRARLAVVLLDLALTDLDGLEVLRRLRQRRDEVPVCVLSDQRDIDDHVRALQAGADDYLIKPFGLDAVVSRLQALTRDAPPREGAVVELGDLRLDPFARTVLRGRRSLELTRREFELLRILLCHPGEALDRQRLHAEVWGYGFDPETDVAQALVRCLQLKLEAGGESRLLHATRRGEFVLSTQPRVRGRRRAEDSRRGGHRTLGAQHCPGRSGLAGRPAFVERRDICSPDGRRPAALRPSRAIARQACPALLLGLLTALLLAATVAGATIIGTPLADHLVGTSGPDVIKGRGGDDRIFGRGGDDRLYGGPGNDLVAGDEGNDIIYGGSGHDTLLGGAGHDRIHAGPGGDIIVAGAGDDVIFARNHAIDRISCGPGRDIVYADLDDIVAGDCEIVRRR